MKKNFLFAMAMAAVFAGCSSDDEPVAVQGDSNGFMTFNVELPSISTTRAMNDQFVEGEDIEYAVDDVTICLLDYTGEILQVETTTPSWTDQGADGINVQRISSTIEVKTEKEPTKVLVVLNNNSNFTLTTGDTFDNEVLISKNSSNFIKDQSATNKVAKGITMTNAAIVNASNIIKTLTPVTTDNICKTQAEALANPVEVYVERIVAKVSVTSSASFTSDIPTGMTSITLNNWELDITNTATYPVRKTSDDWLVKENFKSDHSSYTKDDINRMIGTATVPQRVYWAIDANYADADKAGSVYTYGFDHASVVDNAMTDVDYCLENTFDITNQKQDQTTRVVFKATIAPSAAGYTPGDNFFTKGNSSDIWTIGTLSTEIQTVATNEGVKVGTINNSVLTDAVAGKLTLNETNLSTLLGVTIDPAKATAISAKLGDIVCYEDGICYYVARIKHFGDDLTPWTVEDPRYNNDNKKWLGRYGVLRNNWYELNVTGIKKLGTPTIPTPEDTWDDEVEQYMVYKINILSWAKRTQDVEL